MLDIASLRARIATMIALAGSSQNGRRMSRNNEQGQVSLASVAVALTQFSSKLLGAGLEPACLSAYAPQTYVSAIPPPERVEDRRW